MKGPPVVPGVRCRFRGHGVQPCTRRVWVVAVRASGRRSPHPRPRSCGTRTRTRGAATLGRGARCSSPQRPQPTHQAGTAAAPRPGPCDPWTVWVGAGRPTGSPRSRRQPRTPRGHPLSHSQDRGVHLVIQAPLTEPVPHPGHRSREVPQVPGRGPSGTVAPTARPHPTITRGRSHLPSGPGRRVARRAQLPGPVLHGPRGVLEPGVALPHPPPTPAAALRAGCSHRADAPSPLLRTTARVAHAPRVVRDRPRPLSQARARWAHHPVTPGAPLTDPHAAFLRFLAFSHLSRAGSRRRASALTCPV